MQDRQKITKQLVNLIKKELLAIIAVGAVLAFLFSQSTASAPTINIPKPDLNKIVLIQSAGSYLFNNSPTIRFGQDIKGVNNSKETWTDASAAANFGNSIIATVSTQVTISQITNGTWTLYLTGIGDIIVNGAQYSLGKDKTTAVGTVVINNGTLVIRFGANAQLWEITSTTTQASMSFTQTPTILNIIPANRELRIGTALTPVLLLQDQEGSIMSQPLIEWSSDNDQVATVRNNGVITAISHGTATIKATVSGTNLSTTILIDVPQTQPREMPPIFEINIEPESDKINGLLPEIIEEVTEFVTIDDTVKELIPIQPTTEALEKEIIEELPVQPKSTPKVDIRKVFNEAQTKTLVENDSLYIPEQTIQEILNKDKLAISQRLTVKISLGFKQIASDISTIFTGSNKIIIDQKTNQEIVIQKPGVFKTIKDFVIQLFKK